MTTTIIDTTNENWYTANDIRATIVSFARDNFVYRDSDVSTAPAMRITITVEPIKDLQ